MSKLLSEDNGNIAWRCPGCDCVHNIPVEVGVKVDHKWQWNGDGEKPTISPSVFVHGSEECHAVITDGTIQFMGDCSHKLAGQNVPMVEFCW